MVTCLGTSSYPDTVPIRPNKARQALAKRLEAARAALKTLETLPDEERHFLEVEAQLSDLESDSIESEPVVEESAPEPSPVSSTTALVSALAPIAAPALAAIAATDLPLSYHDAKRLVLVAFERDYHTRVMAMAKGEMTEAARLAGIDRTNYRRMLQQAGLHPRTGPRERLEPDPDSDETKYTDQILKILDDDRRGLRTYEIAAKTKQSTKNAFAILKLLEGDARVQRHGKRLSTLWTLPSVVPIQRIESIPAAVVEALSKTSGPMDARRLRDEARAIFEQHVGKRPRDGSLTRGINRLLEDGIVAMHGANEHGPMYVLIRDREGGVTIGLN
jgi:hypothetical protein